VSIVHLSPFWVRWVGITRVSKVEVAIIALLVSTLTILFIPVTYIFVKANGSDYYRHIQWAKDIAMTGHIEVSHFLYHLLLILVHYAVPGIGFTIAGLGVATFFYLMLGIIIYFVVRLPRRQITYLESCTFELTALALMISAPLPLLVGVDHHTYFGYIATNNYHNPTTLTLKPLALLLFLQVTKILDGSLAPSIIVMLTSVALVVFGTLAKPSYTIVLLPAIISYVALDFLVVRSTQWQPLIYYVLIPAIIVLGYQYSITYGSNGSGGGIIFAPLKVASYYSAWLLPKLLLSLLFPLVVYILYFKDARSNIYLNLSWLALLFGLLYSHLLAEAGPRMYDGNFFWSAEVSLFIVFVMSTVFLLRQIFVPTDVLIIRKSSWKSWVCVAVLGLHMISGVFWYGLHLTRDYRLWW
jgi:hypothetical protein